MILMELEWESGVGSPGEKTQLQIQTYLCDTAVGFDVNHIVRCESMYLAMWLYKNV